jgi:hypothetical protein
MSGRDGRVTQHKEKRDARKSKEMANLKRENKTLKRQLAKVRTRLLKLMEFQAATSRDEEERVEPVPGLVCPQCGSGGMSRVEIPSGVLECCKDQKGCGYRKVRK